MEENGTKRKPIKPMGPAIHGQKRSSLISKSYRRNHLNGTKPMVIILHEYAEHWQWKGN